MTISLNSRYEAAMDFKVIGYVGETNSRTIVFEGYETDGADCYKMRIEYPDGISYEVDITDGSYTVGGSVLREECRIKCQILALKADGEEYTLVKKSDVFTLNIKSSLDGEPAPIPTYEQSVGALDKMLAHEITSEKFAEAAAVSAEEASSANTAAQAARTAAEEYATSASESKASVEAAAVRAEQAAQAASASEANVASNVDKAAASADNSGNSEKEAKSSAEAAAASAEEASSASVSAQAARTAAEEYATSASESKASVEAAAQRAEQAAQAASASEANSISSADKAVASAESSGKAAKEAKSSAEAAAISAEEASSANTAAQAARTAAEESAVSASESKASVEAAQAAVETALAAAEKTLNSIPEDYTELSNDVVGLKSDFGDYKIVTLENLSWVKGRINSSGINYNGAGYAYRTSNYYEFEAETVTVRDDNTNHKNYSLHIFAYDTNDVFISKCAYTDVGDKRIRVNKSYKYRFMYLDDTLKEMPDYTKLRIVYDYSDNTVRGIDKRVSLLETVNQTAHMQRKPRVTFIDDDGHIQFYKLIKPIMEAYNIPYCISYPATYLPYNADTTHMSYAQCKEIVDIGGEILAHGMSSLTSITISEAEYDVVETKRILEEYGFKINGYIYPSGSSNEDVREMIARHYKFAMKTNEAQQAFRINTDCIPSYYINRCNNGGYYDAKSGNYTNIDTASIEYMKMLVDECVEKNGWLIMVSHAGYMPEGSRKAGYENVDQVQLLKDTIEYIQSLKASGTDIDIITASEGFEMFGNAAQYGDYLGFWNESSNYHKTPGCAVNKIGQWDFPTSQKIIH